jgi:hypothetical protein
MWERALILALVVLNPACKDGLAPNEGLDSEVTLDRTRLVPGEPVHITVTVTARFRGGMLQGSSTCLTGYSVLNAGGTVVAPGDVICTGDLVSQPIPSNGYVRRFIWYGYTGTELSGEPLPPGIYRVIGGPGAWDHSMSPSSSEPVSLELVAEPAG